MTVQISKRMAASSAVICFSISPMAIQQAITLSNRADDQQWYWSAEWQAGEREAEADLQAGRYQDFASIDEFLASL